DDVVIVLHRFVRRDVGRIDVELVEIEFFLRLLAVSWYAGDEQRRTNEQMKARRWRRTTHRIPPRKVIRPSLVARPHPCLSQYTRPRARDVQVLSRGIPANSAKQTHGWYSGEAEAPPSAQARRLRCGLCSGLADNGSSGHACFG